MGYAYVSFIYSIASDLGWADAPLLPILRWIDKDGLRRFLERPNGSDLLRDIRRCRPPKNSTSTLHRRRCLSVSYGHS